MLVGDFLYSRAFQMMVRLDSMRVMRILADTTNRIAEGEVLQLLNCHDPDVDEARYFEVIYSKTAKLFEAAGRLGAVVAGHPAGIEQALAEYGMRLGTAFQLSVKLWIDRIAGAVPVAAEPGGGGVAGGPTHWPTPHLFVLVVKDQDAVDAGAAEDPVEFGLAACQCFFLRIAEADDELGIAAAADRPAAAHRRGGDRLW